MKANKQIRKENDFKEQQRSKVWRGFMLLSYTLIYSPIIRLPSRKINSMTLHGARDKVGKIK